MRKLIALTIFILAGSLFNLSPVSAQFPGFEMRNSLVGKKSPEFNLSTLSGQKMSLTQSRAGKSAIILFWATWCPNCHEEMEQLSRIAAEIKDKGIQVILVDIGEDSRMVNSYVKRYKVPYDVLLDEESKVAENYRIIGIPTFFFVGKDGVIKAIEHAIPNDYEKILMQ